MGYNFKTDQVTALIDLYKVAPLSANTAQRRSEAYGNFTPSDQLEYGLLFINDDGVAITVDRALMTLACDCYGIDAEAINTTFYKDKDIVLGKTRWELFVEQCIHYAGTYGRAAEGKAPLTLIPVQELDVPDVDFSRIKVTVIRLVHEGIIVNLVNHTMLTTKTPSTRIRRAMEALIPLFDAPLEDIRSFELSILAYDYEGVVPVGGINFLRYLVYKTTGNTTVVNNVRTAKLIRAKANGQTVDYFRRANMVSLAEIFLRYKNLFLAFKAHPGCAPYINRLRRLADTYHKPLSDIAVKNYIQLVLTGRLKQARTLIPNMDNRELVKIMNAISTRTNMGAVGKPGVFNIRNGRSYCKANAFKGLPKESINVLNNEFDWLLDRLTQRLKKTLEGKTFYIPDYVEYTVPTTEKQFVGNIPWGTVFSGKKGDSTTVGIQWINPNDNEWVDLDLHAFTADGRHFGWNSSYYSFGGECVYSGDMTNAPAPLGAAEAFWVRGMGVPVFFDVSKYRGPDKMKFKLALSTEDLSNRKKGQYAMDPNELAFAPIPLQFDDTTNLGLGYLIGNDFYVFSGCVSNGRVPSGNFAEYLEGVMYQQSNKAQLSILLEWCGARVIGSVEEKETLEGEGGTRVIDLSPENLTASTLLDIVDGKEI